MPALVGLVVLLAGMALIMADQPLSRAVWRRAEDPEAGAASLRVLGAILFMAGGITFLIGTT
ncbi:MAG TPA: hypothetical protein VF665_22520 [Longimicrobium sp.]|jgi:hypothetical protein|uniref:hypothetical protein n=1 Tax=Longimicrobium sp. TaxID=2029185 RepID=UPI002ED89C49